MPNTPFPESDWKLFRKNLPIWQERYMERLIDEYKGLLSSAEPASTKFWALEKRIRSDKKKTGVLVEEVSRSNMYTLIIDLIREDAINIEDLDGFSDGLRDYLAPHFEKDSNL